MAQAEQVSQSIKIVLLDEETEVTLRPLSIKRLREFMKEFNKIQKIEFKDEAVEDEFMTILVNCSAIALKSQLPEQTEFVDNKKASRDAYEDLVDMNIVSKINEVCGGINFDAEKNPNLKAAMGEAGTA